MQTISLALSGGGVRAMAFHMGVLVAMAERGLLENIARISSVSGGSLLTGLVLKEAAMRWPSSLQYLENVYPALRRKLCSKSMVLEMLGRVFRGGGFKSLLYRADLLAEALEKHWNITECLSDLPPTPEIAFEGTTAENGRRFRFKRANLGDYELGYAQADTFPLSRALAVSAAFPGGIGPLSLTTADYVWKRGTPGSEEIAACDYETLHLYDGGVYDNLGMEPLFDAATLETRHPDASLIVSDAGAPFQRGFSYFLMNPLRLKRMMDVMQEQCRALRVRGLNAWMRRHPGRGAYIWIGSRLPGEKEEALRAFAVAFPTTLRRLKEAEFDKLALYGHTVAAARLAEPVEACAEDCGRPDGVDDSVV